MTTEPVAPGNVIQIALIPISESFGYGYQTLTSYYPGDRCSY
jgi:hypothetical protein